VLSSSLSKEFRNAKANQEKAQAGGAYLAALSLQRCQTDRQTDKQTMLVYFTWPTKGPGGHQVS